MKSRNSKGKTKENVEKQVSKELMKMTRPCFSNAEITEQLIAAGVQPTLQRISIAQFILCQADHPTADEIHAWAEKNLAKISLATIYNTLKTLVDAKLIREYRFPHLDKVIYDNNMADHHHFLDEKTQKLYDIHSADLSLNLSIAKKYKVHGMDVLLRGEVAGEALPVSENKNTKKKVV